MDRETQLRHLEEVQRHVAQTERHVAEQEMRIATMAHAGRDTTKARQLLSSKRDAEAELRDVPSARQQKLHVVALAEISFFVSGPCGQAIASLIATDKCDAIKGRRLY